MLTFSINYTGIEEVNMIKNDGTVIHFNNPKAQASLAANTFAITGHSEQKEVSFHVFSSLSLSSSSSSLSFHLWYGAQFTTNVSLCKQNTDNSIKQLKDKTKNV